MYPRFPIPHDLGDELFGIFRVFEHLVADHIVERLLSEGEQFAVGFDELLVRIDQYLPAAVRVVLHVFVGNDVGTIHRVMPRTDFEDNILSFDRQVVTPQGMTGDHTIFSTV